MFEILTTRPRLGVFRSLPEKKKASRSRSGSDRNRNRIDSLGVVVLDADELFGVVLPNSEYGTTTPRRSVSITLSPANNDGGVGTVPYSIHQQASHMSAWVGLLDNQQKQMSPKISPRIDQLHGMSSLGPRKSSNSSGMSFRKNQSHVKKWKLGKVGLAGWLSCTSLIIPDYHWQHCHCPFANPSPQTPRENHCDPPYTETFPCP